MSKKGKGKGKKDDWEGEDSAVDFSQAPAAPALLDGGEPEEEVSDFMAQIANASKKKNNRKKRKDDDFEAAIAETQANEDGAPAAAEEPEPAQNNKKGKGKGKGGKKDVAEEPVPEAEPEEPAQQAGGKKGKKGKKGKEEEFWADIEKIQKGEMEPEEKPQGKGKQQQQQQQQNDDNAEEEGHTLSAAAQKRKDKKERQKQEAQQPEAAPAKAAPAKATPAPTPAKQAAPAAAAAAAPAAAAAAAKKGSPANAIKLALQKQKEEEEKRRQIEEEEKRKWEEEEAARLEEERKKEEVKQLKKEKERLKKEELKKQGLYMTKSEKEKQAQLEERRAKLLLATGGAAQVPAAGAGAAEEQKPKKVVYGKRKKPQPGQAKQAQGAEDKAAEGEEGEEEATQEPSDATISAPQGSSEAAPESWESWEDIDEDSSAKAAPVPAPASKAAPAPAKAAAAATTPAAAAQAAPKAAATAQAAPKAAAPAAAAPAQKKAESESEDSEDESDDDDSDDDEDEDKKQSEEDRKEAAREKRLARYKEAMSQRNKDDLRSPICCILGHVDTGKTKLLDKIRQTNVQENEAGGITQQIGATYFPTETIHEKIAPLHLTNFEVKVPGLLIIDTPGHESFTNLRSRGSSLCNIAILVIDIMHYLEPQTIESLNLLRQRKTPFIVALNKIDRIYSWQPHPNMGFEETLSLQSDSVKREFEDRLGKTMLALAEQGLNAELYTRNQDFRKYVSICPTSAISGEGIPDMIMLLIQLTQKHMGEQLMYISELEATVLEVKVIEGQGTTIDVILSNGYLREGDKIAVCGMTGAIVTNIRAILTPQPLRELRVKSQYVHHKEVKAALGVKISAPGLEKAVAGSRLMVIGPDDDEDEIKDEIMSDLADLMKSLDKSGKGVSVQASTLGSLEALLAFLKQMKIPVFNINIGPVHKKDVMRASIMLEHQKEYATMLCFDVDIDKDAQKMAEEVGVQIFTANIIYHLFDQFTKYINEIQEQRKKDLAPAAVFPCVLKIVPGCVFNKRSPILVGVAVVDGNLRVGTALCVPSKNSLFIGKVTGIEINHKPVEIAKKGQDVAIRIELPQYETPKMVGRHFEEKDDIVSMISRESIDILKSNFREEVSKEEWALIVKLKKVLGIM